MGLIRHLAPIFKQYKKLFVILIDRLNPDYIVGSKIQ